MAKQVFGTEQVIKNLSRYQKDVVNRIVRAATATQAEVSNEAKSVLRPGYGFITGNLQESIQPGAVIIKNNVVEAFVEANAEYASFVEINAKKPFLGPAVLSNREFYRKNMKKALKPPPRMR